MSKLKNAAWSHSALAKVGTSRRQRVGHDYYVNEDWIEIQAQSFTWQHLNFHFNETDRKIQKTIVAAENHLLNSFEKVKNVFDFLKRHAI